MSTKFATRAHSPFRAEFQPRGRTTANILHRDVAATFPVRQQYIVQTMQQVLTLPVGSKVQNNRPGTGFYHPVNVQHRFRVDLPATDEIVITKRSRHHNDLVFTQEMSKLLECFAEQADFETAGIIVKYNRHPVATLAHIHYQSGDGDLPPGLCVVSFTSTGLRRRFRGDVDEPAVNEKMCILAHRIERMSREVKTECFFLVGQQFPFCPFGEPNDRNGILFHPGFGNSEHVVLARSSCASFLIRTLLSFGQFLHELTTRQSKIVHRA